VGGVIYTVSTQPSKKHDQSLKESKMKTRVYQKFIPTIFLPILVTALVLLTLERALAFSLVDFIGTYNSGQIQIFWETGSELDFTGFYIQRSLEPANGFERLLDPYGDPLFFPAKGEGGAGARYQVTDTDVVEGTTYFYILEVSSQ